MSDFKSKKFGQVSNLDLLDVDSIKDIVPKSYMDIINYHRFITKYFELYENVPSYIRERDGKIYLTISNTNQNITETIINRFNNFGWICKYNIKLTKDITNFTQYLEFWS